MKTKLNKSHFINEGFLDNKPIGPTETEEYELSFAGQNKPDTNSDDDIYDNTGNKRIKVLDDLDDRVDDYDTDDYDLEETGYLREGPITPFEWDLVAETQNAQELYDWMMDIKNSGREITKEDWNKLEGHYEHLNSINPRTDNNNNQHDINSFNKFFLNTLGIKEHKLKPSYFLK